MNGYRTLLGLALRNRLSGLRAGSWRKENGRLDGQKITTLVMTVLAFVLLGGMLIFLEVMLDKGMSAIGQPILLPAMALLALMVGMLFISFYYVLSSLYFSRDTVWMGYLPVRSETVLAAKLSEIWLGEVLLGAVILLPAFILFGLRQGVGIGYWLAVLPVCLAAPMLPLTVITLLSTLLTRGTALSRHKDAWIMGGSIVFAVAMVWVEMSFVTRIPEDAGISYFITLLAGQTALMEQLAGAFPPVLWAVRGLTGDVGSLLLFLAVSVGSLMLCWLALGRGYLTLALRQTEMGVKKRVRRITEKTYRSHRPLTALFLREWNEIIKTPAYAFNCLAGAVVLPIMLVVISTVSGSSQQTEGLMAMLSSLLGMLPRTDTVLLFAGIVAFVGFMNPAIDTAVSREGARHEISRMIPVPARLQLTAKLLMGLALSLITCVTMTAVLVFALPDRADVILTGALLGLLPVLASDCGGLLLDILHPRMHWASETEVIKQSANVALGMLLSLVCVALPAAVAFLVKDASVRIACVAVVAMIEAAAGVLLLRFVGEKHYDALEA